MDHQAYKEVWFDEYCEKCEYEKLTETESPCDECLQEPTNWNTHKPVKYKKRSNRMNEKNRAE